MRRMTDQLTLGACGHTTRLRSYGVRACTEPAGHQPPPDAPPTSTEGWHRHTGRHITISWPTDHAIANRAAKLAALGYPGYTTTADQAA